MIGVRDLHGNSGRKWKRKLSIEREGEVLE
jgi:hypothetical protein